MAEVAVCPKGFDPERLQPRLIAGNALQAVLSTECIPEQFKKEPIGSVYRHRFHDILKWVPLEFSLESMSL